MQEVFQANIITESSTIFSIMDPSTKGFIEEGRKANGFGSITDFLMYNEGNLNQGLIKPNPRTITRKTFFQKQ